MLDSGAYFYDVYECLDGQWISVGPIEKRFQLNLLHKLEIDPEELGDHLDPRNWARARAIFIRIFKTRSRSAWCELLEGTDACFSPVLSFEEAPRHPHLQARKTFIEIDGVKFGRIMLCR